MLIIDTNVKGMQEKKINSSCYTPDSLYLLTMSSILLDLFLLLS